MTQAIESMANCFSLNIVPKPWTYEFGIGYISTKPLSSWVTDLEQRVNFLKNWESDGTPNVFWISSF